jgi:hypothetical protein
LGEFLDDRFRQPAPPARVSRKQEPVPEADMLIPGPGDGEPDVEARDGLGSFSSMKIVWVAVLPVF